MSGVFGVVNPGRQIDVCSLIDRMGSAMSHRDWYVIETHVGEREGFGLGRIGIGIFNREPQPVTSEDGNLTVCLSGEFYNTSGLRRDLEASGHRFRDGSDLELALRLYEHKREQFIHDLEGAFVLAIWDRARRELIIANDRFGLYPLYYAHYAGRLVFAPEMKGILCDSGFRKQLDLTALAEYVRFQHLLGDKTFFEELRLLPNASLLRYNVDADRLMIQSYWDFSQLPQLPASLTFRDAVEEAGRLLESAVHRLTQGDHRFGVYLSGGLDSRAILGLIDRDRLPITTITYGLQGCRDVAYARRISAAVGTDHHYFEVPDGKWVEEYADLHLELTEGFHSWIHAHGISVLGQVRPLMDVNLTGLHGAPINWEDSALFQAQDDHAFSCQMFYLLSQETTWPSVREAEARLVFSPRLSAQTRGLAFDSLRAELVNYAGLPYDQRAAAFSCSTDRRLFQYYTVFHRSHLEQRFPFYDYRYFEFIHALPPEMLFKRKLRRAVILSLMPSLAHVPYDKDDLPITGSEASRLTAKLVYKGKSFVHRHVAPVFPEYATLYADYENWLRNELRAWGEGILLGERTLQRDIFEPEFLRSLWRRHQSGLELHTIGKIAPLMTFEMMLRRFYD
jgi:asparagine synthase (glutamine-hydrolysing)